MNNLQQESKNSTITPSNAIAENLLQRNDRGGYTVPTNDLYPFQWNWDAAFSALGWFQFDTERAFLEVDKLLSAQWSNGMVPHIVFHQEDESYFPGSSVWEAGAAIPSSGYSQPPVLASLLIRMQEQASKEQISRIHTKLQEYFPKLMHWHHWFWEERNPTGKGLIAILHPWESGRDNLPDWDYAISEIDTKNVGDFQRKDTQHINPDMRPHKHEYQAYLALIELGKAAKWDSYQLLETQPFIMLDVWMTAVLLRANRDLLILAKQLNAKEEIQTLEKWIGQMEAHFEEFWNPDREAYCTINYRTGKHLDCVSAATFSAFYAGTGEPAHLTKMNTLFDNWCQAVTYMVPSFDPFDKRFEEQRYWRGPVWIIVNYLLSEGFKEAKMPERAEIIYTASKELIKKSGFYEYYSPHTGKGIGGEQFSWTAALWLAWLNPQKKHLSSY